MKPRYTLLLLLVSLAFFTYSNATGEDKTDLKQDFATIDFYPESQFMVNGLEVVGESIAFIGKDIPVKIKKDKLEVKTGATAKKIKQDEVKILDLGTKEAPFPIGFVFHQDKWIYFNPKVMKLTADKFEISVVDMNCDGEYLFAGRDGLLYPGSHAVVPYEGKKIWYQGMVADIVRHPEKLELVTEKINISVEEDKFLTGINLMRVGAGLHALMIDYELSAKCKKHAQYIVANGGVEIESPYVETPGNPGFSEEGKSIAGSSLYWYFETGEGINAHLGYIFYRTQYIYGSSRTIGIGAEGNIHVLNAPNGCNDPIKYEYPIKFPGPGQTIPFLHFSTGSATFNPDPRPGEGGCGFPVSLTWDFAEKAELLDAKFYLVKGSSKTAQQIAASGPNKPSTAYFKDNKGMIAVIPLNPLEPKSTYEVEIKYSIDGAEKTTSWQFHTAKE